MNEPLVSIIIPTFNRAHLIVETLDSIAAQTYQNWECIVVDDGSTDDTAQTVRRWAEKDSRFQFHQRPTELSKGANACRNLGFSLSTGEYIQWYDSDDLMLEQKIERKVSFITEKGCDFVVSRSSMFFETGPRRGETVDNPHLSSELTLKNFASGKVFWGTWDGLYTRSSLSGIEWNEELKSGQEFNFICKYLERKPKGAAMPEVLSLIRRHESSIQGDLRKGSTKYHLSKFNAFFHTAIELNHDKTVKRSLMVRSLSHYYALAPQDRPVDLRELLESIHAGLSVSQMLILFFSFAILTVRRNVFSLYRRLSAGIKLRVGWAR